MGLIYKIIITDSRNYDFIISNDVLNGDEDDFVTIQKSLSEIANGDDPNLYQVERKRGIVYVRFVGKDT